MIISANCYNRLEEFKSSSELILEGTGTNPHIASAALDLASAKATNWPEVAERLFPRFAILADDLNNP